MQRIKELNLKTVLGIVLFAGLMTWLLFRVSAATPFASLEPESASLSSGATVASDSSATGGSFVEFNTASAGGGGGTGTGNLWDDAGVKSFPCSGVTINPGDSWQSKVDANAAGTTFCIRAGTHRMQQIVPKSNNTFIGEPGAIMNGSKVLSGWTQSGSDWVVGGQTQGPGLLNGNNHCWSNSPRCNYPNELFKDNQRLVHVATRADLAPGKWFFDYDADKIYMRDNPSGHKMETSVTASAFEGDGADYVTVKNLIIEKYSAPIQKGVIEGYNSSHYWTVEHNEIRYSQGSSMRAGCHWTVNKNYLHHMGQIGMVGACGGILAEGNEIAYNDTNYVDPGWEGGGTKFIWTTNLIVRGNYVHDNLGPGIWADGHNTGTLYENNLSENNTGPGIFHEIGCDAVIRNNRVISNGFSYTGWIDGAGILVGDSPDVEIYGNTVINNNDGIAAKQTNRTLTNPQCETATKNLWVHDNYIEMQTGQTGIAGNPIYDSNRFDRNTYKLTSMSGDFYRWGSTLMNATEWKAAGHDVSGTWK